jgi:hypothetical protein
MGVEPTGAGSTDAGSAFEFMENWVAKAAHPNALGTVVPGFEHRIAVSLCSVTGSLCQPAR